MVDELCDFSPPLGKDYFFDDLDVDIPYNKNSEQYRAQQYQGSAVVVYVLLRLIYKY